MLAFLGSFYITYNLSEQVLAKSTTWLLQTMSLCLPAFLSTQMSSNEYIQNALSVYLYQYTNATSNTVVRLDTGVPPIFISILAILFSIWWPPVSNKVRVYAYFYKAFQMLIVELMLFSITDRLHGVLESTKFLLQVFILFTIDFINEIKSNTLTEVRGYAIWRVSRQISSMNLSILDVSTSMSLSILLFIARRLGILLKISSSSMSLHTMTEIIFMSTTNLLLDPVVTNKGQTFDEHILRIMFLSTAAQTIENILR